jgi:hypothetical protein
MNGTHEAYSSQCNDTLTSVSLVYTPNSRLNGGVAPIGAGPHCATSLAVTGAVAVAFSSSAE